MSEPIIWIQPATVLRRRLGLPDVPLPVSEATAQAMQTGLGSVEAMARDVDRYLATDQPTPTQRQLLPNVVASLAFFAAQKELRAEASGPALALLQLGLRHAPNDPSLLSHAGLVNWDQGHRLTGLEQNLAAMKAFASSGKISPMLWILTARMFAEAGRTADALALLEDLAETNPKAPRFWDLIDNLESKHLTRLTPT